VTYTLAEARRQILDTLALAADRIALALAGLSEAYEHLDERSAERLEEALFQPMQAAYGRAKSAHRSLAQSSGLPTGPFQAPAPVAPSHSTRQLIEIAVEEAAGAERALADLQDSMLPVEAGDAELRAGLAEIRQLLARIGPQSRELLRTLGR
jgi:hypothetical protein